MRTIIWLGLGILIGAAALGAVWAAQDGGDANDGDIEVRLSLERHDDGRVEVGLQQRADDGGWSETHKPQHRFLAPDAEAGVPRFTEAITVDVESPAERAAREYAAYLRSSGVEIAEIFNAYFASRLEDGAAPGTLVCVIDHHDAGIDALCDGVADTYTGEVELLRFEQWDELREQLASRLQDDSVAALVTTSVPTTVVSIEVRKELSVRLPQLYWIELLDQHLASPTDLYCQIAHSGQPIEAQVDLFWGLAAEVSNVAANQLGVNVQFSSHSDADQQAQAIRDCIEQDASAIATTLVEPDVLTPAVKEAVDAGLPVVSFNSGPDDPSDSGTALHIALDDEAAGRLAGEEFNNREVDGKVLCVIHEPDNIGLHQRCDGFEDTYAGEVERWSAEDPADVWGELTARLQQDDLSAVLTLSVHSAWDVRNVRAIHDIDIDIAAFGFSVGLARDILDGTVMFTILDHPELQAYLSAAAAVMANQWRLDPTTYFNGMSLLIQPQIGDAAYMQRVTDAMFPAE